MKKRNPVAIVLGLIAAAVFILSSAPARAHTIGLSAGEYTLSGDTLSVKLAFARGEVARLMPALDANRDGHITAFEVSSATASFEERVLGRMRVTSGGATCKAALTSAALTEQDGLQLEARFTCPSEVRALDLDLALVGDLAHRHRHVARVVAVPQRDELLYKGHSTLSIQADVAAAEPSDRSRSAARSAAGSSRSKVASFFAMGVEHILTGYDHLVFLLGLVLLRARFRELVAIVTAFTVAHSITLAVAALGIFTPSSRWVEPAIALSIAYVGIENFFVKDVRGRWRITFPFGLIHGFGFAGALAEIELPRADLPVALVSFNLGVEAGQLFAMALVLPIVALFRRKDWFEPRGVRLLSGAVAMAGGVWFVLRVASS